MIGTTSARNVGLVTVAADRPWDEPTKLQVFAVVANHGPEPVEVDVELRVGACARGHARARPRSGRETGPGDR